MDSMCTQTGAATAVLRMGKALRVARRVVTMIPSKQGAMAPPGKMMSTREIYHLSMSMRSVTLFNQFWLHA